MQTSTPWKSGGLRRHYELYPMKIVAHGLGRNTEMQ